MTTIEIELPDDIAESARAAGLLTQAAITRLLAEAIRRAHAGTPQRGAAEDLRGLAADLKLGRFTWDEWKPWRDEGRP
jgi:hypothetical protein